MQAGTYFVQRHDKDGRDLASTIAQAMQARGLPATAGTVAQLPAEATYVVTYVDKWMWDMRMYLYDLRTMGQTHEDVINRALDQLFAPGT